MSCSQAPSDTGNENEINSDEDYNELYRNCLAKLDEQKDLTEMYKGKSESLKKTVDQQKQDIATLKKELESLKKGDLVHITPKVALSNTQLTIAHRTAGGSINVYARNLMRILFDEDEMAFHSITGKQSNANIKLGMEALPKIDEDRLTAIVASTVDTFKLKFDINKATIQAMITSLGFLLTETTKKGVALGWTATVSSNWEVPDHQLPAGFHSDENSSQASADDIEMVDGHGGQILNGNEVGPLGRSSKKRRKLNSAFENARYFMMEREVPFSKY